MIQLTLLMAVLFAAIHIFSGRLRFLGVIPRSRWLSAAGGVSIAYVFIHIFPELSASQRTVEETGMATFLEYHVYLIALAGLILFYSLERMASVERRRRRGGGLHPMSAVFWVHLSSFVVYNGLIGYLLLHRERVGLWSLFTFFLAMALHFLVNDFGLREHYKDSYASIGRFILAGAVGAGWLVGLLTELPKAVVAVLFAFLAGGVVMNVIKEELPEERESRLMPFLAGAAAYSALLIIG